MRHIVAPRQALVVVAIAFALSIPSSVFAQSAESTTAQGAVAIDVVPHGMPSVGDVDALVTVLIISDFQCPFCSRVVPTLTKLLQNYGDRVRFVWANNPLPFHKQAMPAALAALAAHRQGLFWAMHDKIFANQRKINKANLAVWAAEVGCDPDMWRQDLADPILRQQVLTEQRSANGVGARGTPSFLINGKKISGAQPYKRFATEIDQALQAAELHRDSGKSGMALVEAMWTERGGEKGARAFAWFMAGVDPPIKAPPRVRKASPRPSKFLNVPIHARDQIEGNSRKALVTIVEFSDVQCPFCSRAAKTLKDLRKLYGDQVRIVYKHHPLSFHKRARPAHMAMIAAGKQGKFLQFREKAFANQRQLTDENFKRWAAELGLRSKRFERDRKSKGLDKTIQRDMELARSLGLRGTPSFVINGRSLRGAQPLARFRKVIDEEIAKAKASGRKGKSYYRYLMAKGGG